MRILILACLAACEPAVPILLWHSVGEPIEPPLYVTSERFAQQLDLIIAEGYSPITAAELDAIEAGDRAAPPRPVVLTFDDGYLNFHEHALPILKSRNLRATMFVIAAKASEGARVTDDRARYMTWPELREAQSAGVELESHSVTHRNLKTLADAETERELVASKQEIEAHAGKTVGVFAYPFGGNSPHTQDLVEKAGYTSAHSVIAGLDERYARLRISIHASTTDAELSRSLEGSWWARSSR